mmetsp:Transcript_3921/g.5831  ORF Transcript_3921/g.5831 Transcript_3921/m.5831 type:complete len:114 (+) Transcript_3921:157-498(+)
MTNKKKWQYYFGEKQWKADVLLVQEPPLKWDDKGVLGLRGFTAFHWIKEDKVEKDKVVCELVKVKGKRMKMGGKRTLEDRSHRWLWRYATILLKSHWWCLLSMLRMVNFLLRC